MSEVPSISCDIDLPAPAKARLLRIGTEELARKHDNGAPWKVAHFSLCPICLAPTWVSSSVEEAEPTIVARVSPFEMCHPCEDARHRFPDVFLWMVYVLGSRGLIGEEQR